MLPTLSDTSGACFHAPHTTKQSLCDAERKWWIACLCFFSCES